MVREHIVIRNSLEGVNREPLTSYLMHAYCYDGECCFSFNNNRYTMYAGDCMITRRGDLIDCIAPSEGFKVDVIYVTPEFIELSTPQSNYGMRGQLALFNNPIMRLNKQQQQVCALDFDYIKRRLSLDDHHFHRDAMINAVQCMIIDFFDFHTHLYGNEKITSQYAKLMDGFIQMLERGDFRVNRDISYYADQLCVTSKYLSDVSKKVSGFPANYWIMRYTALDISRKLRETDMTQTELADLYGFSSPSYFSRYVQKYLGVSPSDFRE